MSNNDLLTEEEFAQYRPNVFFLDRLEACRQRFGLEPRSMRIVDWGCGRGGLVLWLRERGYDAIGVDIDAGPFARGAELMIRRGHNPRECLFELDGNLAAPCPDRSVHFSTSWQTFEHVQNLKKVAGELARIAVTGGEGLHIFPPHRRLIEPHLFMPLVHWLPKNRLRRAGIAACVRLGVEPHWWAADVDVDRVLEYHAFSVNETFYRRPEAIIACFQEAGLAADFPVAFFRHRLQLLSGQPALVKAACLRFASDIGLSTRRAT